MPKKRVSYNLKTHEIELIKYASKVLEEDMSRLVSEAILYKYQWLDKQCCEEYNAKHVTEIMYGQVKKLIPRPSKKDK